MVRVLNGVIGIALVAVFAGQRPQEPAAIWEAHPAELHRVAELEVAFESNRADPLLASDLADEYLHQREPELALAALRSIDADAQRDPLVQHRLALAYADMGQLTDAVASARIASSRCMRSLEAAASTPESRGCSETTMARIEMNRDALERLQLWGIVDPQQDPERTRLAYSLSYRVARLAMSQR